MQRDIHREIQYPEFIKVKALHTNNPLYTLKSTQKFTQPQVHQPTKSQSLYLYIPMTNNLQQLKNPM